MVEPLRIFEGVYVNAEGETARYTAAVYPPQFYDFCQSWACALRLPFAPDAVHFGYGKDAGHAIERASEEARGFALLGNGRLIAEDGFDFETFTSLGYTLPWNEDIANHPALASYEPPRYEPKICPTPDAPPIRSFRGWQTKEGDRREVMGAVYAPGCDDNGRWGCVVSCPAIWGSNKQIPGIDAEQSLELAEWFLIDQWNHHGLEPKLDQIELTYAARVR
jgi:hypothetical protein